MIELTGSWSYGGTITAKVVIRSSTITFGSGDQDDPEEIREDQEHPCYYVHWYHPSDPSHEVSGSGPFDHLHEAISSVRSATNNSVVWTESPNPLDKIGIALSTLSQSPLNGLRIAPAEGLSGWFIWGGNQFSEQDDFYQPLHASHLSQYCPEVLHYLALPPGSRFLLAKNHEDIWHDEKLLLP